MGSNPRPVVIISGYDVVSCNIPKAFEVSEQRSMRVRGVNGDETSS